MRAMFWTLHQVWGSGRKEINKPGKLINLEYTELPTYDNLKSLKYHLFNIVTGKRAV